MTKTNPIHVFIDMDGVLCDHDKQAQSFGVKTENTPNNDPGTKYDISDYSDGFFRTMPKMPDFDILEQFIYDQDRDNVHILTAVPKRRTSALSVFDEKRDWIREHLPHIKTRNIHIVFREHKRFFAKEYPHTILIDDNSNNINEWKHAGGIGILHTDSSSSVVQAKSVIIELKGLI